jgi:hypothetical protein
MQRGSENVNMIEYQGDGSAEFADLYVRLLRAALDEMDSSPSPRMRERNFAAHVARGISMAVVAPE